MAKKVIDVSKWQGAIDWPAVKADGVEGVIIRAGYGREIKQKDTYFERNYEGARAVGLPVGCYWYSYADSIDRVKQEAQTCLAAIKGKTFELGVWFDQEYEPAILALSSTERTVLVKTFCQMIKAAGYDTGLYCSREFLKAKLLPAELVGLDLWVAAYTGTNSPGNVPLPYSIWQYTSKGKVAGIAGNVDMNHYYKELAGEAAPTPKPAVSAEEYSLTDFIKEVQQACGAKVDGIAGPETLSKTVTVSTKINRKHPVVKPVQRRLNALGFDCGKVDGIAGSMFALAVYSFQKKNGCVSDGIITAKNKTWKKLLGMA